MNPVEFAARLAALLVAALGAGALLVAIVRPLSVGTTLVLVGLAVAVVVAVRVGLAVGETRTRYW